MLACLVASPALVRSSPAWTERLFAPVDIAALVYFRILFGAILLADVIVFFKNGWIAMEFIRPRFHFTYYGFEWLHPLPPAGMYALFTILGLAAFCILIGFAYRISAIVFFLGFTYVFLLEEALYLNHYYFVSLVSLLMIFVPAHRKLSVDAWLRPRIASEFAPAWSLWILRAQMGFVYFYGGVAKLNFDWLQGWPLRLWLPNDLRNFPVLSAFRHEVWLAMFFSYSGLFLDLFAVPLLLWRKTRPWMFTALALFHLTNLNLFDIGIFPLVRHGDDGALLRSGLAAAVDCLDRPPAGTKSGACSGRAGGPPGPLQDRDHRGNSGVRRDPSIVAVAPLAVPRQRRLDRAGPSLLLAHEAAR